MDYSIDTDDAQPVRYTVERAIKNPGFKTTLKYHDIGLILLREFVKFNQYIRPACLPISISADPPLEAAGWGQTSFGGLGSSSLQKAIIEPINHTSCDTLYKHNNDLSLNRGILDDKQLCAGSSGGDTCKV